MALALEIEVIAKPARSWNGVPAAAIYRRYMAVIAVAVAAPRKSDGRAVVLAEHGLLPWLAFTRGGRGDLCGYCTRFHFTVSVCIVRISIVYATVCVYTISYLRSARNSRALETLFQPQVLSHSETALAQSLLKHCCR